MTNYMPSKIQDCLSWVAIDKNIKRIIAFLDEDYYREIVKKIYDLRNEEKKTNPWRKSQDTIRTSPDVRTLESNRIRKQSGLYEEEYMTLSVLFGSRTTKKLYPETVCLVKKIASLNPSLKVMELLRKRYPEIL